MTQGNLGLTPTEKFFIKMAVKPEKTVVGDIKDTYQERSGKISMVVYGKKMLFQA